MIIQKGFIIKQPWADLILSGKKIWEIRGSNCHKRGWVGLICQGQWVGNVEIIDSIELSLKDFIDNSDKHQVFDKKYLSYSRIYAWVIGNVIRFAVPKKYTHKKGCVIWVNLD